MEENVGIHTSDSSLAELVPARQDGPGLGALLEAVTFPGPSFPLFVFPCILTCILGRLQTASMCIILFLSRWQPHKSSRRSSRAPLTSCCLDGNVLYRPQLRNTWEGPVARSGCRGQPVFTHQGLTVAENRPCCTGQDRGPAVGSFLIISTGP